MAGIFISYRRDDTSGSSGRLFDHLIRKIDRSKIFMDVDGIPPGADFVKVLGERVGHCDALLAVIGRNWLTIHDDKGRRRLDSPKDLVRIEIEAALKQNKEVIPVLVDGAPMPRQDELPHSMKGFANRQAVKISHDKFSLDAEQLSEDLARSLRLDAADSTTYRGRPLSGGHAPEDLGSYSHESVAWIEGRYVTLRPTFDPPGSIYAYCTEIKWDSGLCRLIFRELDRPDKVFAHSGQVSAPYQSGAIYLKTNLQGKMRLTVLGRPTIDGEMFGLLMTLRTEGGNRYTPAACPIAFVPEPKALVSLEYGRLTPGSRAFAYAASVLDLVVEDHYASFFKAPRCTTPEPVRKTRIAAPRRRHSTVERQAVI